MWNNIVHKARANTKRTVVIGGAAVVLIVAIALFWNNNKQRILAVSLSNLQEATSYHASAKLALKLPNTIGDTRQRPIVDVSFEAEGDVTELENGQPVFFGRMRNDARGKGMTLFADGELALLSDKVAFRLENLPSLLNPKGNLTEKWTYVDVPALETKNTSAVRQALEGLVQRAKYLGKDDNQGETMYHYSIALTPDEENTLIEAFRQTNSGNRSLQIVTRLLRAYDVRSIDVFVDPGSKELRTLAVTFVQPLEGGNVENKAQLSLGFSDYGKEVAMQEPPRELSVRPDVFGKMFGSGDIASIEETN